MQDDSIVIIKEEQYIFMVEKLFKIIEIKSERMGHSLSIFLFSVLYTDKFLLNNIIDLLKKFAPLFIIFK